MTILQIREDAAAKILECFGDTREIQEAKVTCRECKEIVSISSRRSHAAAKHLKQTVHACRHCPFTSSLLSSGEISRHLQTEHGLPLDETNADSQEERFAALVDRMLPELFRES